MSHTKESADGHAKLDSVETQLFRQKIATGGFVQNSEDFRRFATAALVLLRTHLGEDTSGLPAAAAAALSNC